MTDIYKKWDDLQLTIEYRNSGDKKYVGELYKRYNHLVFGLALKYLKNQTDAEDAVINVFETLFVKLKEHQVLHFKSWLFILCKNHFLQITQKKDRWITSSYEEEFEKNNTQIMEKGGENHLNDETLEEIEEKEELVREAITQLTEDQRKCVEMFYFEKLSYNEIASKTGYDFNKVKSCIQNGKRNIKIYLESQTS